MPESMTEGQLLFDWKELLSILITVELNKKIKLSGYMTIYLEFSLKWVHVFLFSIGFYLRACTLYSRSPTLYYFPNYVLYTIRKWFNLQDIIYRYHLISTSNFKPNNEYYSVHRAYNNVSLINTNKIWWTNIITFWIVLCTVECYL